MNSLWLAGGFLPVKDVLIRCKMVRIYMLLAEFISYDLPRSHGSDLNTLRPRQKRRHFADDIFKCIFLNENVRIPIKISLKFVPNGPINNIPALVQIMAWRRPGDKPLSEPLVDSLTTHVCVTQPQWVKKLKWINRMDHSGLNHNKADCVQHYHDVTWTSCSLKPPVIRLFVQHIIPSHIKETSKSALLALCEGNSPMTGEFPAQRASNAEKKLPFGDVTIVYGP